MVDLLPQAALAHIASIKKAGNAAHSVLTSEEFDTARQEITQWDGYQPTRLVTLQSLANSLGISQIHYKDEGARFGLGSFKALGGAYAALRLLQREISARFGDKVSLREIRDGDCKSFCDQITLVSATDGNHGRSLAWGCQRFSAPCRIYIHAEVSEGRAQAMRDLGAEVIRIDGDYDDSVLLAKKEAEENGWLVVSDTSWPGYTDPPRDVMAGYGVMTHEICEALEQAPTHVFLQGGVGGLAAAVAAGFRQYWGDISPRVVIVEPELAACLFESAKSGTPTAVTVEEETLMAGLSCGEPSPIAWEILAEEATDFLTIPETLVGPSVRLLANPLGVDQPVEAGESAIAGLAALVAARQNEDLSAKLGLNHNSRVVLVGSEGVTDPEIFSMILEGRDAA